MAKSRKVGGLIFTLVFLGAAGAAGYYYWKNKAEVPPEVVTATVTRGEVVMVVTATGDLQPVVTTDVSSQISGQIREILVDYNSSVKQGDVLARLDTATYDSRVRQAEAQLANARANYTLVKLNFDRVKALFDRNLVSQQELDQADAQLQQANAQMLIQQANVDTARTDLSRCTLYSPIDGIVVDRLAEVGRTVAASLNAPTLFTIANDLTRMQINAAVAEADIGRVEVGQEVTFTVDAFPERQFRGRVSQLRNLPKTANNVVTYATIIDVRNEDLRLKPGMTANVSIIVARRGEVVRVPNSALRARVPDTFQNAPATPAASAPTAAAKADDGKGSPGPNARPAGAPGGDRREQVRQLMAEAGVNFRSGPPSPEALARLQALAKERGIELPERFAANRSSGGPATITTRTVYKLAANSTTAEPRVDPITVKLGISDGLTTEVVEGLAEGDVVVTSITPVGGSASAGQPARNPFGGGGPGGRRF